MLSRHAGVSVGSDQHTGIFLQAIINTGVSTGSDRHIGSIGTQVFLCRW